MLIDAGTLLRDLDIRLKFVGFTETENDRKWKQRIQKNLGPCTDLVDRVSRQELIGHLQAADLMILPRRRYLATVAAFPTKFAEYVALGKPVVVSDVDDTAYFVKKYR